MTICEEIPLRCEGGRHIRLPIGDLGLAWAPLCGDWCDSTQLTSAPQSATSHLYQNNVAPRPP